MTMRGVDEGWIYIFKCAVTCRSMESICERIRLFRLVDSFSAEKNDLFKEPAPF